MYPRNIYCLWITNIIRYMHLYEFYGFSEPSWIDTWIYLSSYLFKEKSFYCFGWTSGPMCLFISSMAFVLHRYLDIPIFVFIQWQVVLVITGQVNQWLGVFILSLDLRATSYSLLCINIQLSIPYNWAKINLRFLLTNIPIKYVGQQWISSTFSF